MNRYGTKGGEVGKTLHILFWDIDGTLIRTSKAGLYAFEQAVQQLWGKSVEFGTIQTAGMTDNFISRQVIRTIVGREPEEAEIRSLCRRYEELLPIHLAKRKGFVLPEVRNILSSLHNRPDYRLLLLTGNSKIGAQIKLNHFGLAQYFDFSCSAFAEQYECRDEIAGSALKFVQTNWPQHPDVRVYVIGDTPHDISCGKTIGAHTIAVATGGYSFAELSSYSPWWPVERLPGPAEFMDRLLENGAL